jgi:hypothetical protein
MDGLTVESGGQDSLAIVTVATVVTCSACSRRWLAPIADYQQGWDTCRHCGAHLFLPPLDLRAAAAGGKGTAEPAPDDESAPAVSLEA